MCSGRMYLGADGVPRVRAARWWKCRETPVILTGVNHDGWGGRAYCLEHATMRPYSVAERVQLNLEGIE